MCALTQWKSGGQLHRYNFWIYNNQLKFVSILLLHVSWWLFDRSLKGIDRTGSLSQCVHCMSFQLRSPDCSHMAAVVQNGDIADVWLVHLTNTGTTSDNCIFRCLHIPLSHNLHPSCNVHQSTLSLWPSAAHLKRELLDPSAWQTGVWASGTSVLVAHAWTTASTATVVIIPAAVAVVVAVISGRGKCYKCKDCKSEHFHCKSGAVLLFVM